MNKYLDIKDTLNVKVEYPNEALTKEGMLETFMGRQEKHLLDMMVGKLEEGKTYTVARTTNQFSDSARDMTAVYMRLNVKEIVKCKDCKYRITVEDEDTFCYWCGVWANETDLDVFCSYGERKEG